MEEVDSKIVHYISKVEVGGDLCMVVIEVMGIEPRMGWIKERMRVLEIELESLEWHFQIKLSIMQ